MRSLAHVLCVACWLLVMAAPCFAQPASDERAQKLFFEGVAHSRAGRWEDAVSAFERSRELVERPSVLQNLAVALRKTKRSVRAFELIDGYLRRTQQEPPSRARTELAKLAEELRGELAVLELEVAPNTAEVELDGERVAHDGSVLTVARDPGTHRVRVVADSHRERVLEWVGVAGRSTHEEVRLAPARAESAAELAPKPVALRSEPKPSALPFEEPPRTQLKRWAWGLMALGLALEISGTAFSLTAGKRSDCTGDDCTPALQREVRRLDWIANVSWAAGGASLVTGGVLLWTSHRDRARALHVVPVARGLGARLTF